MLLVLQRMFDGWAFSKKKPASFASEKEAYDFCRKVYRETGGVTPELRKAFDLYKKHTDAAPRTSSRTVQGCHSTH